MAVDPGRLTRAAIHADPGDVEIRLSAAGNWVLAIRRADEREWHVACSGDLNGGAVSQPPSGPDRLRYGKLLLNADARRVFVAGREVQTSRLEYGLLATLAAQPTRVISKRELMRTVWDYDGIVTRTLDSHASRLRVKIRRAGAPGFVINAKQVGYRHWDARSLGLESSFDRVRPGKHPHHFSLSSTARSWASSAPTNGAKVIYVAIGASSGIDSDHTPTGLV